MPRAPRIQAPGAIYHVTVRGVRRTDIFRTDADRSAFLHMLRRTVEQHGWLCFAYCLMTNHFHLVVQTPDANIAAGMQALNSRYAQWFNGTYGLEGHAFERRYHTKMVESAAHLAEASRYVVLNPVRAGICTHPSEWPWSSYRATAAAGARSLLVSRDAVLAQFFPGRRSREQAYVVFVEEGLRAERPP